MADEKPKKPSKVDYNKKTARMDFEVKGGRQIIWVRQYWKYNYTTKMGAAAWTNNEKKKFHREIEKCIRKAWSGKFILEVEGDSDFAKFYKKKTFKVKFDIDPKDSGAHWKVTAVKVPKGKFNTSVVNWSRMEITLDTEDTVPVKKRGSAEGDKQSGAAHEFGHAIGNTKHVHGGHGDEYKDSSAYKAHKRSIMHSGMQIKKRHADYLVGELNKVIKDTKFKVKSVR